MTTGEGGKQGIHVSRKEIGASGTAAERPRWQHNKGLDKDNWSALSRLCHTGSDKEQALVKSDNFPGTIKKRCQ